MGLSFFNQRRAKEKQKLSASIDSAETLIDAKDENASLPQQEEEGLSLDPQPIENVVVEDQAQDEQTAQETEIPTAEELEQIQVPENAEEIIEQEAKELEQQAIVKVEETKISDAQKIKNAKQKANKGK